MPINSIIQNPAIGSLNAAYAPIILMVNATRTDNTPIPPVVYCDIYFNSKYYKTLSKTSYEKLNTTNTEWHFDIQDAAQEYLKAFIPKPGLSNLLEATPSIALCFCRFRSSGFTTEGFIQSENTAPVQATDNKPAINGTGVESSSFYIVNVALQHHEEVDLPTHLNALKKRIWNSESYPLTHRPDGLNININGSDYFPIILNGQISTLRLNYKFFGQNTFHKRVAEITSGECSAIISNATYSITNYGYRVSWDLVSGSPSRYKVSTPNYNLGASIETFNTSFFIPSLPLGNNLITITPVCNTDTGNSNGNPITVNINVTQVIIQHCVGLSSVGYVPVPEGTVGEYYEYIKTFAGTMPMQLSEIIKPDWMTIEVDEDMIKHYGTPITTGTYSFSYKLSNCEGLSHYNGYGVVTVYPVYASEGCSSIPSGLYAELVDLGGITRNPIVGYCEANSSEIVLPYTTTVYEVRFYNDAAKTSPATINPNKLPVKMLETVSVNGVQSVINSFTIEATAFDIVNFNLGDFQTMSTEVAASGCPAIDTLTKAYTLDPTNCFNII